MKKNVVKKCLITALSAMALVFVIAACGNKTNDSITTITDLTKSAGMTSAVGSQPGTQTTAPSTNVTNDVNTSDPAVRTSEPITTGNHHNGKAARHYHDRKTACHNHDRKTEGYYHNGEAARHHHNRETVGYDYCGEASGHNDRDPTGYNKTVRMGTA